MKKKFKTTIMIWCAKLLRDCIFCHDQELQGADLESSGIGEMQKLIDLLWKPIRFS